MIDECYDPSLLRVNQSEKEKNETLRQILDPLIDPSIGDIIWGPDIDRNYSIEIICDNLQNNEIWHYGNEN